MGPGCVKTCLGKTIENCFLCRTLTTDFASIGSFRISEIETEILRARRTYEFSHSLGHKLP